MAIYPTSPPAGLLKITACEPTGHRLNRRQLLARRLSADARMPRVWYELRKRLREREKHENYLEILYYAVDDAHAMGRRPPLKRAELAGHYQKTAKQARKLAALVKGYRMDSTVYHLYSEEAARSTLERIRDTDSSKELTPKQIASANWHAERHGIPVVVAYLDIAAPRFPVMSTILEALAVEADKAAQEAMIEPRVVERPGAGAYAINYFIRSIAAHLRENFGGEMRKTLATLASVALELDIDEDAIRTALRRKGGY